MVSWMFLPLVPKKSGSIQMCINSSFSDIESFSKNSTQPVTVVTIPLPGDGQMGLLVTVRSSEYTIGNVDLRVSSNGRTSASQADDVPIRSKADIQFRSLSVRYWPKADTREFTFLGNNHINTN